MTDPTAHEIRAALDRLSSEIVAVRQTGEQTRIDVAEVRSALQGGVGSTGLVAKVDNNTTSIKALQEESKQRHREIRGLIGAVVAQIIAGIALGLILTGGCQMPKTSEAAEVEALP